jgi:hypothetical protein
VAISEGGANVGRIILREQEGNLNVIDRKHKGGWEAVEDWKQARRDGTLQNHMDCKYWQQAAIEIMVHPKQKEE